MHNRNSTLSSTSHSYNSYLKAGAMFGLGTVAFIAAQATGVFSALSSWWRGTSGSREMEPSDNRDFSYGVLQSQTCEPTMQLISSEFKVNTHTDGDQGVPRVASLIDGKFVVVWTSDGQDGSSFGVHGQICNDNGTLYGSEFQVSTDTHLQQMLPAVAGLTNGKFVIVWNGYLTEYAHTTFGRIYDADGMIYSSEFQLDWTLVHNFPLVASLPDGEFVIVSGVNYGQLCNANGTLHGSEFQANDGPEGPAVAVAGLTDGKFVIVWNSQSEFDIYGKIYYANGSNCTPEIKIVTSLISLSFIGSITLTGMSNGNFVVVWVSLDGSSNGIIGRMYSSDGVPYGPQFQINTYTSDIQTSPAATGLNDEKFIVVWMSNNQDGDSSGIFGQMYTANGLPYGLEFQVNSHTTNSQSHPSVIGLNGNKFVIAWSGYWSVDNYNEVSGKISMRSSLPVLIENSLLVSSHETTTSVNSANIHATSEGVTDEQIIFIPSNVNHGFFNNPNFTQDDIKKDLVFFTHTGSMAPSYCLSVSDGNWLIGPYQARVTYVYSNPILLIAGISSGAIGALVTFGYGFFAYRRGYRRSHKNLMLAAQGKEKFIKEVALQLLGTFGQIDKREGQEFIDNLEKFISALGQNGINIYLEIGKDVNAKSLTKAVVDLLKPYLITERGCCKTAYSFFGHKIKTLRIDSILEHIKEHAESLKQELHIQAQGSDKHKNIDVAPIIEILPITNN